MTVVEVLSDAMPSNRQQRWGHYLTLVVGVLALLYGLNMRSSALNATVIYNNVQAGIRAEYPRNWLLDEDGDYVFQVRDMSRVGYKTTIRVATRPVSASMTERNVLDSLNITRPLNLSTYTPLSFEATTLPDESPGTAMTYSFVETETNPFLASLPVVVSGLDILTIRGGQALIITFRADAATFDEDVAVFNRFLRSLDF